MVAVGFLQHNWGPVMRAGQRVTNFNPVSSAIFHAAFSDLSFPSAYQSCRFHQMELISLILEAYFHKEMVIICSEAHLFIYAERFMTPTLMVNDRGNVLVTCILPNTGQKWGSEHTFFHWWCSCTRLYHIFSHLYFYLNHGFLIEEKKKKKDKEKKNNFQYYKTTTWSRCKPCISDNQVDDVNLIWTFSVSFDDIVKLDSLG